MRELLQDFEMVVATRLHGDFRVWHPESPSLQWLVLPLLLSITG